MLAPRAVKSITSRQNPRLARIRTVRRERRGTRRHVVLDGSRVVTEAARAGVPIETLLVSTRALERDAALRTLTAQCDAAGIDVARGTDPVMQAASPLRAPATAVAIARHQPLHASELVAPDTSRGGRLMAVGLQDPGNVGAVVRTAAAAGIGGVIVDASSADPFGWKALRGAMGHTFHVPVADTPDAEETLARARAGGWTVAMTTPRGGTSIYDTDFGGPTLVVVGNEGAGLDGRLRRRGDAAISIPMEAGVESLNVAVAAALIAYEMRRYGLAS